MNHDSVVFGVPRSTVMKSIEFCISFHRACSSAGKRLSDIYTQMPLQNRALHVDAPEFVPYLLNSDERIRQCGRPVALCCADSADRFDDGPPFLVLHG